jgi:flagellar basal-body rod protein FlgB
MLSGGFVEALKAKMAWASARQNELARNIANASTPGFTPNDAAPFDFAKAVNNSAGLKPAATHPGHIALRGSFASGGGEIRIQTKADAETTPDGNGVNLEQQMMKVAETQLEYQEAASLYRKAMTMWRTALGGRN